MFILHQPIAFYVVDIAESHALVLDTCSDFKTCNRFLTSENELIFDVTGICKNCFANNRTKYKELDFLKSTDRYYFMVKHGLILHTKVEYKRTIYESN